MDYSEIWGVDVEEAVKRSLMDLKCSRDEVEVTVLEQPSKGFFGIGSKLAKVRVEKKKTEEKEAALNLIAGTWYTVGGMPYNLKAEFSGDDMKAYLPDSAEIYFERIVQTVFKTSYGYFYVIADSKDDFSNQYGYRLETEYPESMYIIDTANPFAPAESMTDSLCRDNGKLSN